MTFQCLHPPISTLCPLLLLSLSYTHYVQENLYAEQICEFTLAQAFSLNIHIHTNELLFALALAEKSKSCIAASVTAQVWVIILKGFYAIMYYPAQKGSSAAQMTGLWDGVLNK